MTRKSAASAKPTDDVRKVNPKEYFEDAIKGITTIIDAQIRNCKRVDNLVDIMMELKQWELCYSIDCSKEIVGIMVETYEMAKGIVNRISLEDIKADKFEDELIKMVPDIDGLLDENDVYEAYVIWRCIRPIGEKIEQLRMVVAEGK